jgi:hypothetical protein
MYDMIEYMHMIDAGFASDSVRTLLVMNRLATAGLEGLLLSDRLRSAFPDYTPVRYAIYPWIATVIQG